MATLREDQSIMARNIVVDLRNLRTGTSLRDRHAQEKYLEVDKYPEALVQVTMPVRIQA